MELPMNSGAHFGDVIENATTERRLLYPGILVRGMLAIPEDRILPLIEGQYRLALSQGELQWVECLQECLLDSWQHEDIVHRFPHPDEERNVAPRDVWPGDLFYEPHTIWWARGEHRFPLYLAITSYWWRSRASRQPPDGFLRQLHSLDTTPSAGGPGLIPEPPLNATEAGAPLGEVRPEDLGTPGEGHDMKVLPQPMEVREESGPSDGGAREPSGLPPQPNGEERAAVDGESGSEEGEADSDRDGNEQEPDRRPDQEGHEEQFRKVRGVCPILGCGRRPSEHLRDHIYSHMPPCLRLTQRGQEYTLTRARNQARCLRFIAQELVGSDDLNLLLAWLNDRAEGERFAWNLPPWVLGEMENLARYMNWPVEDGIRVGPSNHFAALLHWRSLALMSNALAGEAWQELHELAGREGRRGKRRGPSRSAGVHSSHSPNRKRSRSANPSSSRGKTSSHRVTSGSHSGSHSDNVGPSQGGKAPRGATRERSYAAATAGAPPRPQPLMTTEAEKPQPAGPSIPRRSEPGNPRGAPSTATRPPMLAVDSHFHLDRLERRSGKRGMAAIRHISQRRPRVPVEICGGILNYCDPAHYREIRFPENKFFRVAVGIHPKHARAVDPVTLADLQNRLCDPKVVGVSEVGLDYSVHEDEWPHQETLLRRILKLGVTGKVLIIHMRGEKTDPGNGLPSRRIRAILAECQVSLQQRIHIHCCQLPSQELEAWRKSYPQCYFGFSGTVCGLGEDQVAALRRVPSDRLLIETDSPHLSGDPFVQPNSPAYVGEVAQEVARCRGVDLEGLLQETRLNAVQLYGPWHSG